MTIFNLLPSLRNRKALIAVSTCAALTLVLTGCGLGTAAPALPDNSSTHGVALHGIAHGGQQGIVGGTVQLWEAGGTSSSSTSGAGYGTGAIALISNPVTTGGNVASLAPSFAVTAYSITSNVATFTTAAQTFSVGQAVTLSGFANGTFFNGQTVTVLAAGLTSTSFEANFVNANTSGSETTASVTLATPGSFNITGDYTCHTGALVYLTVTGGTAGTGVNSAINLVAPLGLCSSLSASTFININEVTTAAAAYALGNFYTTAGGIGAPATTQAQVGLTNAFATVNTLVSISTGVANASFTLGTASAVPTISITGVGTGAAAVPNIISGVVTGVTVTAGGSGYTSAPTASISGGTGSGATLGTVTLSSGAVSTIPVTAGGTGYGSGAVTVTPETSKLYLIADIIASCVNSSGPGSSGCSTLFSNVVTPPANGATPPTPTDVMQAAVDMSINPTAGTTTKLTNLFALQTPQSPYIGTAQSTQPTDLTIGVLYADPTTTLTDPGNVSIDSNGNVWIVNHNGSILSSLVELGPTGTTILSPTTSIAGTDLHALNMRNMAIDTNNNIWLETTSTGHAIEYVPATPTSSIVQTPSETGSLWAIAIDGNNNVFYGKESMPCATAIPSTVDEFPGGTITSTNEVSFPCTSKAIAAGATANGTLNPGVFNSAPENAAVDTNGNVWLTNANASTTAPFETEVTVMSAYSAAGCSATPCVNPTYTWTQDLTATGSVPVLNIPWGIVAAPSGIVWFANNGGNTLTKMSSITAGANFGDATSLNKPESLVLDGAGNLWTGSFLASPSAIEEFSSAGTPLSPIVGTTPFNVAGFSRTGLVDNVSIAIDPSGNVWTVNMNVASPGLFELVGAAAPTVTPIALSLNESKVGAKP